MVVEVVKVYFIQKVTKEEKRSHYGTRLSFRNSTHEWGFIVKGGGQWMEDYKGIIYIIYRGKRGFLFNIYFYLFIWLCQVVACGI